MSTIDRAASVLARQISFPSGNQFRRHGITNFSNILSLFDWSIESQDVVIDLSRSMELNYQAFSLLISYVISLQANNCQVKIIHSQNSEQMWRKLGTQDFRNVLYDTTSNFRSRQDKPLFALRNSHDLQRALVTARSYSNGFDIEYENTLGHILSEVMRNTLEHGRSSRYNRQNEPLLIPSLAQFNWYQRKDQLSFIIIDLGIGIKKQLERAYPGFERHSEAIRKAIEPSVSGTFNQPSAYGGKDNAGMGLYISSEIIRRLQASFYIISGSGLLHVSPLDITARELSSSWPGTIVFGEVQLSRARPFELQQLMQELYDKARDEIERRTKLEADDSYYVHVRNHFGPYAEDKESAIRYRNDKILPRIDAGSSLKVDFSDVKHAPHSFLSALLATPIQRFGISAYKKIRIINASPEIREILDYILAENTPD